jgi:asparagine synthase (glutamine-hydrolysing)
MCGICGVVQISGEPRLVLGSDQLVQMTDVMTHRGPNDRGIHTGPGIAIGVRRLSIVDVEGGHQPFENEDGTVIGAQNGELYNHDTLRQALSQQGHRFRSRCDTEVLPHLYEEYGDSFVEKLRGKFGLVVWDARRRRAVIARDRLGVKPIYWARTGDLLVFASELKSLLASGLIERQFDPEALDAYLTLGFVPGPRTLLRGVWKLDPGGWITAGDGTLETGRYWRYPPPAPDREPKTVDEYGVELLDLLREAVRLRLMSDVPLGAMLSGGLDSSLIVALMAEASSEPVKTFAVGFREDGDQNELEPAARVAAQFGCDHHAIELSLGDSDIELDTIVWHLDEPVAELSTLGFFALSRLASEHVTVALAGQGADELFGGYRKHLAAWTLGIMPSSGRLGPLIRRLGSAAPESAQRFAYAWAAQTPADRFLAMSGALDDAMRTRLMGPAVGNGHDNGPSRIITETAGPVPGTPLGMMLYLDAQLALVDNMLHYFDRMSMANSLEVRVPYLDHRVVEWAARLPDRAKIGPRERKRVLKSAARALLPDDVVDRRKVSFFRRSAASWLQRQLKGPMRDVLLDPNARYAQILRADQVRALVRGFQGGDREHAQLVLSILMLETWLHRFDVDVASSVELASVTT